MKKETSNKASSDSSIQVGKKIRRLRLARGISLQKLAEETHMSYSYLSGLENGRHSITLTNLQRLAAYFGVDLVFFLQKSNKPVCVFDVSSEEGLLTDEGTRFHLVSSDDFHYLQVTVVSIPYPDDSERRVHKHMSGNELIYVISGAVVIVVEDKTYSVAEGQGIIFASDAEHVVYGDGQAAKVLLITAPPYNRGADI
jgi:transcriptional regulator with XRE-family HTH domain